MNGRERGFPQFRIWREGSEGLLILAGKIDGHGVSVVKLSGRALPEFFPFFIFLRTDSYETLPPPFIMGYELN